MPNPETAIKVQNVDKTFRIYPDLVRARLKQNLFFWKKYYQEKHALTNINLKINKGEVVGLLGPNGAGKTTLLRIIAGISRPTRGQVFRAQRVVPILVLGLGFHPRLTGFENIELAGMLYGMTRQEVRERRDWIIEFSELKDYIHQPITAYSMGMRARLSFSIAACQAPDILIIDEALATGDKRFLHKCFRRLHEIVNSGATVLFVSHNIWSIQRLTQRCVLIDEGRILMDGPTTTVVNSYIDRVMKFDVQEIADQKDLTQFVGTGEVRLTDVRLLNESGAPQNSIELGGPMRLELDLESDADRSNINVSLYWIRSDDIAAFELGGPVGYMDENFKVDRPELSLLQGHNTLTLECAGLLLSPGHFHLRINIYDDKAYQGILRTNFGHITDKPYYYKPNILEFSVRGSGVTSEGCVYYQPIKHSLTNAASDAQTK